MSCDSTAPATPLPTAWQAAFEGLLRQPLPGIHLAVSAQAFAHGGLGASQGSSICLSPLALRLPQRDLLRVLAHEVAHVAQQRRGAVRLDGAGAVRLRADDALEAEADGFAARAVASLRASDFDASRLAWAECAMAGEWLPYTFVSGRPDLPTDVEGWVRRFNRFGRLEEELPRVIEFLMRQGAQFDTEAEFVMLVRMVVEKLRRPMIGGEPVVVAIPYRDDQRGGAIRADVELVRQGTGAEVVVLVPRGGGLAVAVNVLQGLEAGGIKAIVVREGASLAALRINGLYVSGGPNDHPGTTGEGRPRAAKGERVQVARARHDFEEAMIRCAVAENIPLLGICGGSWRVAGVLGGDIRRLPAETASTHAGPMDRPQDVRHNVAIRPASMLDQIVRTDNYRNAWPTHAQATGDMLVLPVNSVHWAESTFPLLGGPVITARGGGANEAFEVPTAHFQLGIQWHPEYAQNGLAGYGPMVGELHRRILSALGDAAEDSRAARILQRAFRRRQARTGSATRRL